MLAGRLRIGTCSWKYPSWEGLVYSRAAGIDYLAEYARKYRTVEVDQWFWNRLPSPADVAAYRAAVEDDFRFTVKAPNALTLTHLRGKRAAASAATSSSEKPNPDFLSVELLKQFLDRLEPLRALLGAVMLQFGYLNRKMVNSQAAFLEALDRFFDAAPPGVPYGVEIRNPNWLNREHFAFLKTRGIRHVFLQGYYLPPIFPSFERFSDLLEGAVVVRLHGPDRAGMEERTGATWNRIVEPRDAELASVADMVRSLLKRGLDVFLNINNHYEGSAPLTIDRLRSLGLADG